MPAPPAKRRRGRPPLDPTVPSIDITIRMATTQYDLAYANARASRCTVSEYVRRVLKAATRDQ